MSKKMRWGRLIITGCLWTIIYMEIVPLVFYYAYDFNLLSAKDWHRYTTAFLRNDWVIHTGRDVGLMLGMILFIPFYLIGWRWWYRCQWRHLIPRRFLEKKAIHHALKISSMKKAFEPARLRVQSSAILGVAPQATQPTQVSPAAVNLSPSDPIVPVPNMPTVGGPADAAEVQQMMALFNTSGISADFYPHINIDEHYASFAISNDNRAIVVQVINRQDSTWAVDLDADITASDWFYETGIMPAPAKDIIPIAQGLTANEDGSVAVPVLLLMSGTLLNTAETMNYMRNAGVMLLRLDTAEADDVPLFTDFLNEFFNTGSQAATLEQPPTPEIAPAAVVAPDTHETTEEPVDMPISDLPKETLS